MSLHLYSDIGNIPEGIEYIKDNEDYFRRVTLKRIDKQVNGLLRHTDNVIYENEHFFKDRFGCSVPWRQLSTGGKTILNIFYNPNVCFDTLECGENALADLKNLTEGYAIPNVIYNYDDNDIVDVIVNDSTGYTKYSYWDRGVDFLEEEEGNGYYYIY